MEKSNLEQSMIGMPLETPPKPIQRQAVFNDLTPLQQEKINSMLEETGGVVTPEIQEAQGQYLAEAQSKVDQIKEKDSSQRVY